MRLHRVAAVARSARVAILPRTVSAQYSRALSTGFAQRGLVGMSQADATLMVERAADKVRAHGCSIGQ
jgi:hypothetical protein